MPGARPARSRVAPGTRCPLGAEMVNQPTGAGSGQTAFRIPTPRPAVLYIQSLATGECVRNSSSWGAIAKSFIFKHLQKHTSANTARIAPVSRLPASADFPQVSSCFLMLPNWEARAVTRIPHDLGGGGAKQSSPNTAAPSVATAPTGVTSGRPRKNPTASAARTPNARSAALRSKPPASKQRLPNRASGAAARGKNTATSQKGGRPAAARNPRHSPPPPGSLAPGPHSLRHPQTKVSPGAKDPSPAPVDCAPLHSALRCSCRGPAGSPRAPVRPSAAAAIYFGCGSQIATAGCKPFPNGTACEP